MFTISQIEEAHKKVKSGADFPHYIQEIKEIGVQSFETLVKNGVTEFLGQNNFSAKSEPKYSQLIIVDDINTEKFKSQLNAHQKGKTDLLTFCRDCAENGIVKWVVRLDEMTCTYYDKKDSEILVEKIPN